MRTLTAHLTNMLGTREQTRARCLRIVLRDGSIIGITDHDRELTIDLLVVSDAPLTYSPTTGIMPSDVSLAAGLDADNFEVSGPLDDVITRAAILGRRFQGAQVWLFDADWNQDLPDVIPLMKGHIGEARVTGGRFTFEVRSLSDLFNTVIGELMTPYCSADYGDAKCGKGVANVPATITAVTSDFQFTCTGLSGTFADGYFRLGQAEFLTGALAGTAPIEVFDYLTAGAIELFVPLAERPMVGDTLQLRLGCSKLRMSSDPTIPTCLSNANVDRFRGYHAVPGSDTYLRMPIPGNPTA